MNIALSGAHGVGKTTLGRGLYQYYHSKYKTYLNAGIARKIIAQGYALGADATIDSYVEYIIEHLSALSQAKEYDLYLSDRSLLDAYAYALNNYRNGRFLITARQLELLHQVWELEREKYDLYLYLPVQFPLEQDGVRPTDEEYQNQISQTIFELLQQYHLTYLKLEGNSETMLQNAVLEIERFQNR